MEENNSNDSACPLVAILHRKRWLTCLSRVFKIFADVYLLIATALTWGIGFHNRG